MCSRADSPRALPATCAVQAPVHIRDVEELAGSAAEEAAAAGRGTGLGAVGLLPLRLALPLPPRFEGPLHRAFVAAPAAAADTARGAAAAVAQGSGPGCGAGGAATGAAPGRGTPGRQRREARPGAGREAAVVAGTGVV